MTKARDTREDLIGGLGPHEGLRRFAIHGEVSIDDRLEFAGVLPVRSTHLTRVKCAATQNERMASQHPGQNQQPDKAG
jgi:hypothetical protein